MVDICLRENWESLGADLFGGVAGIGLNLLYLADRTGEPALRVAARRAAELVAERIGAADVASAPRDDFARADFVAAPRPDPGVVCAVAARLAAARLLTCEVFVRAAVYRAVAVRVDLSGGPADRVRVSAVVESALRRYLDPLAGGDDQTGWPFGEPLRPSALLRCAQRALGDLADVAGVAIGLDGADAVENCRDVPPGVASHGQCLVQVVDGGLVVSLLQPDRAEAGNRPDVGATGPSHAGDGVERQARLHRLRASRPAAVRANGRPECAKRAGLSDLRHRPRETNLARLSLLRRPRFVTSRWLTQPGSRRPAPAGRPRVLMFVD